MLSPVTLPLIASIIVSVIHKRTSSTFLSLVYVEEEEFVIAICILKLFRLQIIANPNFFSKLSFVIATEKPVWP